MADTPKDSRLSAELHRYIVEHSTPPDAVQQALIEETATLGPIARMQIAPEQGAFMTIMTGIVGARRAVEVGTFTGYSALCIARGLPPDGRLVCCEVDEDWAKVARRYWQEAGVSDRIDLRLAPALETLRALPVDEAIDFAFIDADKVNYAAYYEELMLRLRPNGVILVDNTLWSGRVIDLSDTSDDTDAIRAFNDQVASDDRVDCVLLPISDGLTLLRKR